MLQNVLMVVDDHWRVKHNGSIGRSDVASSRQTGYGTLQPSGARQRKACSCDTFQPIKEPVK